MPLIVKKSDGSKEVYLHTKVMGTIAAATGDSGCYQEALTDRLAEAVTTFLSRHYCSGKNYGSVESDEIHSMVKVVLCDTGYPQAALALQKHRIDRQIKRSRINVIKNYPQQQDFQWFCPANKNKISTSYKLPLMPDGSDPQGDLDLFDIEPWNKSRIIAELEDGTQASHDLARVVAGAVEEKVLKMDCQQIFASVVHEIVRNELWQIHQAEYALRTAGPQWTGIMLNNLTCSMTEGVEWNEVAAGPIFKHKAVRHG